MLSLGRAVLTSRPRLLLLDEPSMGLAPLAVQKIFETIRLIADQGMTLLLVEQNARLALQASRRGYVLQRADTVDQDEAASLLASPRVRAAYLGAWSSPARPCPRPRPSWRFIGPMPGEGRRRSGTWRCDPPAAACHGRRAA